LRGKRAGGTQSVRRCVGLGEDELSLSQFIAGWTLSLAPSPTFIVLESSSGPPGGAGGWGMIKRFRDD